MNLNYSQSTGVITTDEGGVITTGWAGNGEGKNNPRMQAVMSVGPLPQGIYGVGEWEETHAGLGPLVARLIQFRGKTFNRAAFYIHGPAVDPEHRGQESKGCIVIPRPGREAVQFLNPLTITVTE